MGSRNILTVLIVVFAAVLLYNFLYFTGTVGDFAGTGDAIEPLPQDPRFDLPGLDRPRGPQASGQPLSGGPAAVLAGPRATAATSDLALGAEWGRNPFLTPREAWALANYRPRYVVEPGVMPGGLMLSAIVIDSSGRKVAIINGDIVTVGQTVAGMEVVEMLSDAVVFRLDGQRHVLRLADLSVGLSTRGTAGRY